MYISIFMHIVPASISITKTFAATTRMLNTTVSTYWSMSLGIILWGNLTHGSNPQIHKRYQQWGQLNLPKIGRWWANAVARIPETTHANLTYWLLLSPPMRIKLPVSIVSVVLFINKSETRVYSSSPVCVWCPGFVWRLLIRQSITKATVGKVTMYTMKR